MTNVQTIKNAVNTNGTIVRKGDTWVSDVVSDDRGVVLFVDSFTGVVLYAAGTKDRTASQWCADYTKWLNNRDSVTGYTPFNLVGTTQMTEDMPVDIWVKPSNNDLEEAHAMRTTGDLPWAPNRGL